MTDFNSEAAKFANKIESDAKADLSAQVHGNHSQRLLADAIDLSHTGLAFQRQVRQDVQKDNIKDNLDIVMVAAPEHLKFATQAPPHPGIQYLPGLTINAEGSVGHELTDVIATSGGTLDYKNASYTFAAYEGVGLPNSPSIGQSDGQTHTNNK